MKILFRESDYVALQEIDGVIRQKKDYLYTFVCESQKDIDKVQNMVDEMLVTD